MAPPHGACSAEMMGALAQAGFEAACISHSSVHAANSDQGWAAGMGAEPAAVINGLPVVPRFGLRPGLEGQLLLSAYLSQPIVPMCHHWDLQHGLGPLIDTASSIQALGEVTWADMNAVARGNFHWRIDKATLRVRTYARRFCLEIPEGIETLSIELPANTGTQLEFVCRNGAAGDALNAIGSAMGVSSFSVPRACEVEVTARPAAGAYDSASAGAATPLRAVLRRVLAEARDRTMPLMFHRWPSK